MVSRYFRVSRTKARTRFSRQMDADTPLIIRDSAFSIWRAPRLSMEHCFFEREGLFPSGCCNVNPLEIPTAMFACWTPHETSPICQIPKMERHSHWMNAEARRPLYWSTYIQARRNRRDRKRMRSTRAASLQRPPAMMHVA